MNKPTEKDYAAAQAIAQYSLDPMAKYWNGKTAQIIADRVAEETITLCFILADIREKTGVGIKPMLSELADAIKDKMDSRVAEALADHIAEADKMVWQDIRTAPRNGR